MAMNTPAHQHQRPQQGLPTNTAPIGRAATGPKSAWAAWRSGTPKIGNNGAEKNDSHLLTPNNKLNRPRRPTRVLAGQAHRRNARNGPAKQGPRTAIVHSPEISR